MSALTLERIAARLDPPRSSPRGRSPRAAVAALLRQSRGPLEVLLMQRAERDGDRWSGQVSFPGGREEDGDSDLLATAVRETREEIGLDLARSARLLGCLPTVRAMARGRVLPMTITPFVFQLTGEPTLALGDEATDAFWLPLDRAAGGTLDGTHDWSLGPVTLSLPCWRYEGHLIWGLTYGMLRTLILLADPAGGPDTQRR